MDFKWPNDTRTSNKRDEIRAASLPQGSIPTIGHSPHLRRSRDIPPVKLAHEQRAVDEFRQGAGRTGPCADRSKSEVAVRHDGVRFTAKPDIGSRIYENTPY
jgi:hypothetical protein